MSNQSNAFQIFLLAGLGVIALVAVLIFAGVLPGFRAPDNGVGGKVVLWGTVPEETLNEVLADFGSAHDGEFTLEYVYKDARQVESELVEALGAGRGPDLVILPHTSLVRRWENIFPIPYQNYSQLDFNNNFLRESRLYLTEKGILALPLYLDPLVLYTNADLLASAKLVEAPKTWKEMETVTKALNQIDAGKNIVISAIALGKGNNIGNARDVLSLLMMQAGNAMTRLDSGGKLNIVLSQNSVGGRNTAADALDFFNRFANPTNDLYSWNSTQPEAREAFLRGRLAMYLGYASEYNLIRRQNPQLNVEVALVPQISKNTSLSVARMYGVSVLKGSQNLPTAYRVATLLSEAGVGEQLAQALGLPPAQKALYRSLPGDPVQAVFYQSAIVSVGWLDPNPEESQKIFQKMVENSQSGLASTGEAIKQAVDQLQMLVK